MFNAINNFLDTAAINAGSAFLKVNPILGISGTKTHGFPNKARLTLNLSPKNAMLYEGFRSRLAGKSEAETSSALDDVMLEFAARQAWLDVEEDKKYEAEEAIAKRAWESKKAITDKIAAFGLEIKVSEYTPSVRKDARPQQDPDVEALIEILKVKIRAIEKPDPKFAKAPWMEVIENINSVKVAEEELERVRKEAEQVRARETDTIIAQATRKAAESTAVHPHVVIETGKLPVFSSKKGTDIETVTAREVVSTETVVAETTTITSEPSESQEAIALRARVQELEEALAKNQTATAPATDFDSIVDQIKNMNGKLTREQETVMLETLVNVAQGFSPESSKDING